MVSQKVWQNWGRDASSKVVESDDGEGMRGEGMLQGVVHAVALSPAAQGQHKRADTPVEEGQVEEDMLRHLTLAYPITMARPGGGVSLNSSSVSR